MPYTTAELLAVTASRLLDDHTIVFAGVGIPLVASILARATHAPHLTVVVEGGVVGPDILPGRLPISTNEMRAGRRAMMLPSITHTFLYAQRGCYHYGFLGGAQIDRHGNINTSVIGSMERPRVRLPGSGGACDIISHCRKVFIVTAHERRRFVERVDFITSPGYLTGGSARRRAGLLFGEIAGVVTDLALLDFHPVTRQMQVAALQPGVEMEQVQAATGFELGRAGTVAQLAPPAEGELAVLRTLDPDRMFLG
jgi:glutaconate CoA-transferase, subunit B